MEGQSVIISFDVLWLLYAGLQKEILCCYSEFHAVFVPIPRSAFVMAIPRTIHPKEIYVQAAEV